MDNNGGLAPVACSDMREPRHAASSFRREQTFVVNGVRGIYLQAASSARA